MLFRKKIKVGIFVDGQNVFQECREQYNHGSIHPLLLGDRLLAKREQLVMVHYHSGIHTDKSRKEEIRWNNSRYNFMKETGVDIHVRNLQYAWKWMIDKSTLPPPNEHHYQKRQTEVESVKIAREKGVDTGLVLNAMIMLASRRIDKAIIVSADRDIAEIIEAAEMLDVLKNDVKSFRETVHPNRRSDVLIVSFSPHFKRKEKEDEHYKYLTKDDFEAVKDNITYKDTGDEDINRKEAEFLHLHKNKVKHLPRNKRKKYKEALRNRQHFLQ